MTLLQEVEAHLIMSKNALREYETTAASNAGAVLQEINDALRVLETYKVMEGVHPTIDSEPVSKPLVFRSADKRLIADLVWYTAGTHQHLEGLGSGDSEGNEVHLTKARRDCQALLTDLIDIMNGGY